MSGGPPLEQLDRHLTRLAQASAPTPIDHQQRDRVLQAVGNALSSMTQVERLAVEPYGSYLSGYYNTISDLDLAITGAIHVSQLDHRSLREIFGSHQPPSEFVSLSQLNKDTKSSLLRQAAKRLVRAGVTHERDLQRLLHARIPIIKFRTTSGIEVDLAVGSHGNQFKARVLALLGQVCPLFPPLYRLVKCWARAHDINDGATGTFNSHCLAMLTIFYLQTSTPAFMPPLWRLFYATLPGPQEPRILQSSESLMVDALNTLANRAPFAAQTFRGAYEGATNLVATHFCGLVKFLSQILHRYVTEAPCKWRICPWVGQLVDGEGPDAQALAKDWALMVEEPFDFSDNCARTFGSLVDPPWTLQYAADVCERSARVLGALQQGIMPVEAALVFLFGPYSIIHRPLCGAFVPEVLPKEWQDWTRNALSPAQGGNPTHVLRSLIDHIMRMGQARREKEAQVAGQPPPPPVPEALSGAALVPDHCMAGPHGFKESMLLLARKERLAVGSGVKSATSAAAAASIRKAAILGGAGGLASGDASAVGGPQWQKEQHEQDAQHVAGDGGDESASTTTTTGTATFTGQSRAVAAATVSAAGSSINAAAAAVAAAAAGLQQVRGRSSNGGQGQGAVAGSTSNTITSATSTVAGRLYSPALEVALQQALRINQEEAAKKEAKRVREAAKREAKRAAAKAAGAGGAAGGPGGGEGDDGSASEGGGSAMQGGPGADEESSQGPATAQQLQQKSKDRTPLSVRDNAQLAELADAARVVRQAKEQAKREARRASKEGTQAAAGGTGDPASNSAAVGSARIAAAAVAAAVDPASRAGRPPRSAQHNSRGPSPAAGSGSEAPAAPGVAQSARQGRSSSHNPGQGGRSREGSSGSGSRGAGGGDGGEQGNVRVTQSGTAPSRDTGGAADVPPQRERWRGKKGGAARKQQEGEGGSTERSGDGAGEGGANGGSRAPGAAAGGGEEQKVSQGKPPRPAGQETLNKAAEQALAASLQQQMALV